ncbi:MAG: serine/threonine-protein kinase [Gemmatimonadaceae bacterium]
MLDRNDPATMALMRAVTGQYSIEREVGRGGMGVVYLGVDEQLERPVAIKTLPPHLAVDPKVRDRFLREAKTAGRLSHPNIVPIYAAAERDAVVYFAMRYINGESLAERITRLGPLSPGEVVSLLKQLASALGYAHASGVVHRDIKTENVLLDSETGRAMLTDFGIARVAESQSLTATGTVLGTVQYMSPEQVSGDTLDGRSDLYSLGILAFFCLCGRFPFERPTASAIVVAHVTSMPPKLCSLANGVPAALGDIVDRLLAKSPADRYENGEALRAALDALPTESGLALVATNETAYISRAPAKLMDMAPPQRSNFAAPPAPIAKDADEIISSADAEQIYARAAELQANTGMIVPPSSFQLGKSIPTDTVGFNAAVVRASAVEAGIDAQYVDRALAERARATATARTSSSYGVPATISATRAQKINRFLGGRTKIELETAFDGELNDIGFEEVADEVRSALGEMVTVSAVGRTLTVTSAAGGGRNSSQPRRVQIYLTSRNGRTTVRAFEDLKQQAAAMFVGITLGGGFSLGSGLMGAVMGATKNPALAFPVLFGMVAVAFGVARTLFVRVSRKREVELRDVLQRVITRAQDSLKDQGDNKQFPRR